MADTFGGNLRTRIESQIVDALDLARYIVENGITDKEGAPLSLADLATIQKTASLAGVANGQPAPVQPLNDQQRIDFEAAYYRLAIATSPVTAETLRNTLYAGGAATYGQTNWIDFLLGTSPAQRFTRRLWLVTICVAAFVLASTWWIDKLGMNPNADEVLVAKNFWQAIQPWGFGALGACAYLLRSGHYYIYSRTFDLRRTPEYFNRILLGAISGGAIILFVNYLTSESDTVTSLGATALGFIAGYSSDFLFNTIERIVNAIFPKVAVENVPRDDNAKKSANPVKPPNNDGGGAEGGAGTGTGAGEGDQNNDADDKGGKKNVIGGG